MTSRGRIASLACILCISVSASAQTTTHPSADPKGGSDVSFDQRSPLSELKIQHLRYGLEVTQAHAYDIAKERFFLNVPEAYDAGGHWGVIVWSNAGRGGGGPTDFIDAAAKRKLIWVSPCNAGNERGVGARIGLALDAIFNLRQRYALDEKRTFIAGVSGGGKVSQMAAMAYPDVFDGAICCVGANWYRDIAVPGKANTAWPATFHKPPAQFFAEARDHVAFVLITGEKDLNQAPVHAIYDQGFTAEKFKHVTLWDVPGMGHQSPPLEWFEKALDEVDAVAKQREHKLKVPTTRKS
jgi:pimeloyl-ACP methyl ester carboxylesterase